MKIEIITTGNEIMSGLTLDTNFRRAAEFLTSRGFNVNFHTSVGDNKDLIQEALSNAGNRAEAVIVSGGLGPTPDDLTAGVASRFFSVPLEPSKIALDMIERRFKKRGRKLLNIDKRQAYVPKGSKVLKNCWGTAPGFEYDKDGVLFFFLPGVPKEFEAMIEEYVIPALESISKNRKIVKTKLVKTFGLRESEVAQRLEGIEKDQIYIGYRSHFPEIHLRISAQAETRQGVHKVLSDAIKSIDKRLGDYVFSTEGEELEEVVGRILKEKRLTLSLAESCTGGLVANRITNVPGSSEWFERGVVSYSNESKEEILGVSRKLIESLGAVSSEVVEQMAEGVRSISNTDIGVGVSGIAGPSGGSKDKPVGTVFIAISLRGRGTGSRRYQFHGSREEIKLISSETALNTIRKFLINDV